MKVIVCLDKDRPGRLAEFKSTASRIAAELTAGIFFLHTGRELVCLADMMPRGEVDHLVVCAHGGSSWLLDSRGGVSIERTNLGRDQVTVAEMADAWSRALTHRPKISLAACNCLRSPETFLRRAFKGVVPGPWSSRSYQRGGEASFGARLRGQLVWLGLRPRIRGHRSAGHLTANPILAELTFPAASQCTPLFELALPDVPVTTPARRRWASKKGPVVGRPAERWLLFDDSVVEEIALNWRENG